MIKLNTLARSGPSYGGDEDFHVSLDISFGGHGHQGLAASQLNMSLMREYPSLRLIVLVLKQFLTTRGLGEVFTGGMSSYAILLLTTRFLQELSPSTTADIGASLLGILDFYGNHLQPSVTGISVANMCYFSRHDDNEVPTVVPYHRSAINRRHLFRADGNSPPTAPNDLHRPYKFDPLFVEDPVRNICAASALCLFILSHILVRVFLVSWIRETMWDETVFESTRCSECSVMCTSPSWTTSLCLR